MGQGPGAGSRVDMLCLLSSPVHESPVALLRGSRGGDRNGGAFACKSLLGAVLGRRELGPCTLSTINCVTSLGMLGSWQARVLSPESWEGRRNFAFNLYVLA